MRTFCFLASFFWCLPLFCCNCLDIQINGSQCFDCAPDGWEVESPSPDVWDNGSDPLGLGCSNFSQDGGATMGMAGGESSKIDLEDLIPGATYYFSFEIKGCQLVDPTGELNIAVGDYDELITVGLDWIEVIICFTASSSSEELLVASTTSGGIMYFLIDHISCDDIDFEDVECAEGSNSEVTFDEPIRLCPGEEHLLEAIIEDYDFNGDEVITWESDPSYGVDFLSDDEIHDPIIEFPEDADIEDNVFDFFITIEFGNCIAEGEVRVRLNPTEIPEFDFIICADYTINDFPEESEDRYEGEWTGPFDFEDCYGEFKEFTFIIDDDQNNCLEEHTYELFIEPIVIPEFDFPLSYCVTEDEDIRISEVSDNGIEGQWDFRRFNPNELGVGTYLNIFEPDEIDFPCARIIEIEIEIIDGQILDFILPATFCIGDSYVFPDTTLQGIPGMWSTVYDTISQAGNYINIFIPTNQDCTNTYTHPFKVIDIEVIPTSIDPTLCDSDDGQIDLISNVPTEYSIDGGITWQSQGVFENLAYGEYEIMYRSTELISCGSSIIQSLSGGERPQIIDITGTNILNCEDDSGFITIDANGNPTLEFSIDGGSTWQIENTFTNLSPGSYAISVRSTQDMSCISESNFTITAYSYPTIISSSARDVTDCGLADGQIEVVASGTDLQFSIDGGVTWQNNGLFTELPSGNYEVITRTHQEEECILLNNFEILAPDIPSVEYNSTNPTNCFTQDGSITLIPEDLGLNLEYSIDNGNSWQSTTLFEDLSESSYNVIYRLQDKILCSSSLNVTLLISDIPVIEQTTATPNMSCTENQGSILVTTQQADNQFSIDNGVTWEDNGEFINLEEGSYTILIRPVNDQECIIETMATVEGVMLPQVEFISADPSSCQIEDGTIDITNLSTTQNIEISLDSGSTWQTDLSYTNLSAGVYQLLIRDAQAVDCVIEEEVRLNSPDLPDITNIDRTNDESCIDDNGIIDFETTQPNLEFSIDNGASWQNEGLFENLAGGTYDYIIRNISNPDCRIEGSIILESPVQPEITLEQQTNPNTCAPTQGQLILSSNFNYGEIEFSIDNGNSWQIESTFLDLSDGQYTVTARSIEHPDCQASLDATLIMEISELGTYVYTSNNPSACLQSDGQIIIDIQDSSLEFSINDGISFSDSPLFIDLPAGEYLCIVRKKGTTECIFEFEVTLIDPACPCDPYSLDYIQSDITCINNEGQIKVNLDADESIEWRDGSTASDLLQLSSDWYYLTITYQSGECEYIDSIFITEVLPLTYGLEILPSDCLESNNGSVEIINTEGGNGEYNYSLDNGQSSQTSSTFFNLSPEVYQLLVSDAEGCTSNEEFEILLSAPPFELDLQGEITVNLGDTIILNPLIDENNLNSFEWSSNPDIINPGELIAQVIASQDDSYTLSINYGNGCTQIRQVNIKVILPDVDIFIPNIINPNSNENILFIQGPEEFNSLINSMLIYDRWGNLVFENENFPLNDRSQGWNPETGYHVLQGVYTYVIDYSINGKQELKVGSITLVR